MKRVALVLFAIVLIGSIATAQMAKSGAWGVTGNFQVATSPQVPTQDAGFKFMVSDNLAIHIGVGLTSYTPSGGSASTGYDFNAGIQYYMESKGGNVAPFIGASIGYGGASLAGGATASTMLAVTGWFGGEYFFSPNFSWGGAAGLGFVSSGPSGATSTGIGTGQVAMLLTWYVN